MVVVNQLRNVFNLTNSKPEMAPRNGSLAEIGPHSVQGIYTTDIWN